MTEPPTPTRERLLAAARRMFAEQGYNGTSVGEIEAAAGLSPRSGALYKHFPSKQAVLAAVMAQHTDVVEEMRRQLEVMPLGDLRTELTLVARWGLAELRREHELTRIVMKEGDRFPEMAETFRQAIVLRGHRMTAEWVTRYVESEGGRVQDPDAIASVLTDSLVGYTLQEVLFGPAPAGVGEEAFVAAWVEMTVAAVRSLIEERSQTHA
jgi:AcrR family transcriptional regulator